VDLSPATIYSRHCPSPCELRPWLRAHEVPEAELGAYQQVLARLGRRHEANHLAGLGPITDLSAGTFAERIGRTGESIARGERAMYQPVLRSATRIDGEEVRVVGIPDFLIRDGAAYRVRDCKLALHADEERHPEILRQLELYGWLFERTVGAPPTALEVVLGDSTIVEVPFDGGDRALAALHEIRRTTALDAPPYSPVGWTKCLGCGFRSRCWAEAEGRGDVALVYGVDQGLARALRQDGVTTIRGLLDRFDEATLAGVTRPWGGRTQKVGRKAGRILEQARATASNSMTVLFPPALPVADHYVMFGLEGVPPQLDELDKVYLWGTQVFGAATGDYRAAVAGFGPDGDRRGWEGFLAQSRAIFGIHGDIPFVHWHHYETTKIRAYMDRYGDDTGLAERVLRNCVDLLPITRDAVVLPDPSYSLKVVERRAGYRRTLDEYGGDWSIARYIEAVETDDEAAREAIMREILAYNREDLEATWAVMEWLRSLA
jgi:predicted RecB family nuclease